MKKQSLAALLALALIMVMPGIAIAEDSEDKAEIAEEGATRAPEDAARAARGEPVHFELQVRNLPSGGNAWRALRPVNALGGIDVQSIDGDRNRVVIRVRGTLHRDRLEAALAESNIMLVYLEQRGS